MLIGLWSDHKEDCLDPSKSVWYKVANTLTEAGFPTTGMQAETQWKNLTKKYRDTIDHNARSGNSKKNMFIYGGNRGGLWVSSKCEPQYLLGSMPVEQDVEDTEAHEVVEQKATGKKTEAVFQIKH